jgi:hypothetical protein
MNQKEIDWIKYGIDPYEEKDMELESSKYFDRYMPQAKDEWRTKQMVTFLRKAENKEEMEKIAGLFVFDMTYDRGDICLAMKIVESEKGW